MQILNRGAETAKNDTQEIHEALQAERSNVLGQVLALQLAARLLAQAEAQRLARRKSGDSRVAQLQQLDLTTRARIALLDTELEVAAIRVPPVSKTEALIHGRVTDDAQRAAGRVTVALVKADGSAVEGVKPVEVDDAGYYAFVIDAQTKAALGADAKLSVAVQRGDAAVVPAPTAGFTLASGGVAVKDVALSGAELDKLKLRSEAAFSTKASTATVATVTATPRTPAAAPASGTVRKAAPKRGGKPQG